MSRFWTSLPGFSGDLRFGFRLVQATIVALCAFVLSSCSPEPSSPGALSYSSQTALAPPDANERPLAPGQSAIGPDGLPMMPPHGVKIEDLFAPDVRDPIERVKRVEGAVVSLRHDFDAVMPAIQRLVSVESDMQNLISQLDTLVGNPQGPAVPAVPVALVADASPLAPADAANPPSLPPFVAESAAVQAPATPPLPPQTEAQPALPANAPAVSSLAPLQPLQPQHAPLPQVTPLQVPKPPPEIPKAVAQPPPQQAPPPVVKTAANQQAPPPAPAPVPKPAVAPPPVAQAAKDSAANAVLALRLGEHGDTTRLVLDLSGEAHYRYDLDNSEHLLVIELTGTAWKAEPARTMTGNATIASYSTQKLDDGVGTRLIVQLKDSTKVLHESVLAPEGTSGHRIVLDLKK